MFNPNELSQENLTRIGSVLKIVLDDVEMQGKKEATLIKIEKFERENIIYDDVVLTADKINTAERKNIIEVLNEALKDKDLRKDDRFKDLLQLESENMGLEFIEFSKEDLRKNVVFKINDLKRLKEIDKKIKELLETTNKKVAKKTILYLSENGDLYREPKDKYCYPMGAKSKRRKVIIFLCRNKGYQQTDLITDAAGYSKNQTTSVEIAKIRDHIWKYLKIFGKELIESKKGSGYKINPKYKINLKNK